MSLSDAELRRLWTIGKATLIWERKRKRPLTYAQHCDLAHGRLKPPADLVSTEELVEELRKDPFSLAKMRRLVQPAAPESPGR